jgi:hypothetical protein
MGAALYLCSRIVGSIHDSSADWGESWIDADPFRPVTGAHRQNDLLRLAALAAEVEAGLFARNPQGPDATRAGSCAGRCARGPPSITWTRRMASRISMPGLSMPSAPTGRSRTGGGARQITVPPKFGRYPGDPPSFTGRRVDLLGRSLAVPPGADPATVLHHYLAAARTASAKALIHPEQLAGKAAWQPSPSRGHDVRGDESRSRVVQRLPWGRGFTSTACCEPAHGDGHARPLTGWMTGPGA